MSDKFNEVIQDIAVKHGVVIGKDDPILILQTMNEKLIEETHQAQAAMLVQFREEMESISSQWKNDAKDKAEKVLNAALVGSKETMARLSQENAQELVKAIKEMITCSLAETRDLTQKAKKFSIFVLFSSATILMILLLLVLLSRASL